MLTEVEKQHILQTCQMLLEKEEYNLALQMVHPLQCIMGSWMKGKIHMAMADKIANSFTYKHYCTEGLQKQYRDVLACAYEHLYKTGCLLPSASYEIRDLLNPVLWYQIGKAENELARTRPYQEESNDWEYEEDFQSNEKHHVDSMIDQIEYWSLSSSN